MAEDAEIHALAAAVGLELPTSYFDFLARLPTLPKQHPKDSVPILRFGEADWRPYSREKLLRPVRVNVHPPTPAAREMAPIAASLNHPDPATRAELVAWLEEGGFTLERLASGFCIGDDGNGDPVFVDPTDREVYFYHHDGMYTRPLAASLAELIAGSAVPPDEE